MLTILPVYNQILNIGFGPNATHTTIKSPFYRLEVKELSFPLVHPILVERNEALDRIIDRNIWGLSNTRALRRWLRAIPILGSFLHSIRAAYRSIVAIFQ